MVTKRSRSPKHLRRALLGPLCPDFESIGRAVGRLVAEKNRAYGDSFNKCAEFLKLLYPRGVLPSDYGNMLALIRIFDKQMRIATDRDALGESPYSDIAGYGILGVAFLSKKEAKHEK